MEKIEYTNMEIHSSVQFVFTTFHLAVYYVNGVFFSVVLENSYTVIILTTTTYMMKLQKPYTSFYKARRNERGSN